MTTATRIEPKLAARRIEVARDQGRRRLRRLLALAGIAGVVAVAVAATQSPLLDVDAVQVQGTSALDDDTVRQAAGVVRGEPLVALDTAGAARSVEALAQVASAEVHRSWSGTVEIRVRERQPVAVAGSGAAAVLVDGDGLALAAAPEGTELPTVAGAAAAAGTSLAPSQRQAVAVVAALPSELAAEVAEVRRTRDGVVLELDDGIEVRWGDTEGSDAKAESLAVLLDQADRATIATIDVTVPRAATLTRNNGGQ
jgi:cell division protein FtsQ